MTNFFSNTSCFLSIAVAHMYGNNSSLLRLLLTTPEADATGAHNTIVTSRAGKDLVSCLVSGLLTIGPRFGGAIDDAARCFQRACDEVSFCSILHKLLEDAASR